MKCEYLERLTWPEGLTAAASLRVREEGMVVEVTEKASIGMAWRMEGWTLWWESIYEVLNSFDHSIMLNLCCCYVIILSIRIFSHWQWCNPLLCVDIISWPCPTSHCTSDASFIFVGYIRLVSIQWCSTNVDLEIN